MIASLLWFELHHSSMCVLTTISLPESNNVIDGVQIKGQTKEN